MTSIEARAPSAADLLPADKPHAFVYFITIHNSSDRTITLLGRKWVVFHADGTRLVGHHEQAASV